MSRNEIEDALQAESRFTGRRHRRGFDTFVHGDRVTESSRRTPPRAAHERDESRYSKPTAGSHRGRS